MENLFDTLLKLAATALGLGLGYLAKMAVPYITKFFEDKKRKDLVNRLVKAAEQMFYSEDPDGSVRRGYVMDMLMEAGYELTDILRAEIEAKVFDVNLAQKGVDCK